MGGKLDILDINFFFSRLSTNDKKNAIEGIDISLKQTAAEIIQKASKQYIANKKNVNKNLPPRPSITLLQDNEEEELPIPPLQTFYKKSINKDTENVENPLEAKKTAAQISADALLQIEGESDKKKLKRLKTNKQNKQKTKVSNEMDVKEVRKQSKKNNDDLVKLNYFLEKLDNK